MPMPPLAQSHPEAPAQGCSSSCAVRHLNDVYEQHWPRRKGHFRHVISTIYEYSGRSRRWAAPQPRSPRQLSPSISQHLLHRDPLGAASGTDQRGEMSLGGGVVRIKAQENNGTIVYQTNGSLYRTIQWASLSQALTSSPASYRSRSLPWQPPPRLRPAPQRFRSFSSTPLPIQAPQPPTTSRSSRSKPIQPTSRPTSRAVPTASSCWTLGTPTPTRPVTFPAR